MPLRAEESDELYEQLKKPTDTELYEQVKNVKRMRCDGVRNEKKLGGRRRSSAEPTTLGVKRRDP
eukprot:scaffold232_cov67-Phaeocystis_antarctica.AAC.5